MRRSRSTADPCVVAAVALLAVASFAAADPILDALDDEIDLAEAVALLEELLGGASGERVDLVETALRDAAALRATPLDVNRASFSDLVRVPLIDAATAVAIIARRAAEGPFRSVDELDGVAGIRPETVEALSAYLVVVESDAPPPDAPGEPAPGLDWSLRVRASCRESELRTAGALGPAAATSVRLRLSRGGFEAGIGCQKDAREPDLLDHRAFWVGWRSDCAGRSATPRVSAVAGDFIGSWGQGIVLSGPGFPTVDGLPRARDRTRGYDGGSESIARRGLVVETSRGGARVTLVGARTRLDAAIDDRGRATTIRTSGYHRTEGERSGAEALRETLVGIRAVIGGPAGWEVGLSWLRFRYDPPLATNDPERLRFRFEGDELEVRGADVRFANGEWRVGAEAGETSDGGRAALASARLRRGATTVRLGLCHFSREYWSPLGGGAPGFSSGGNAMAGWVGVEYRAAPRVRSRIRLSVAGRPWRSYSDELPEVSRTWSGGLAFPVGRIGDLEVEARERISGTDRGAPPASTDEVSRMVRVTFDFSNGSPLRLFMERTGVSAYRTEEGSAVAIGARTEVEIARTATLTAGITQSTRRGSARPLVQYEPSLPGEFGLRSLSESGARWYARVVAGLTPHYGLSIRIGGGPGRERSEIGVALDTRGF